MSMTCRTCRHPDLPAVDQLLVAQVPLRDIARQHGLSKDSLHRHKAHCLPKTLARAAEIAAAAERDRDLFAKLADTIVRALDAKTPLGLPDHRARLQAVEIASKLLTE